MGILDEILEKLPKSEETPDKKPEKEGKKLFEYGEEFKKATKDLQSTK